MFERFTDRARRVVVLAQEEARMHNHNYIGTEHLLVGLAERREVRSLSEQALSAFNVSAADLEKHLVQRNGIGTDQIQLHIPFTPRLTKVFELAYREALQLGHNDIAPEQLLLALIREGEGEGMDILKSDCQVDPLLLRQRLYQLMSGYPTKTAPDTVVAVERITDDSREALVITHDESGASEARIVLPRPVIDALVAWHSSGADLEQLVFLITSAIARPNNFD